MKRVTPSTPAPEPRQCRMCDGPATYLGVFGGGDYDGFGCASRGCGDRWLVRREAAS